MAVSQSASEYYYSLSAPITAEPFSYACRFYGRPAANASIGGWYTNGASVNFHTVYMATNGACIGWSKANPTQGLALPANLAAASAWNTAFFIVVADNSRNLVVNADFANRGTDATTVANTWDSQIIGAWCPILGQSFQPGGLCEWAAWNIEVTDDTIQAFHDGYSPELLEPHGLKSYCKMIDTNVYDVMTGEVLTKVGSQTKSAHPRVFYSTNSQSPKIRQAVGKEMQLSTGDDTYLSSNAPTTNYESATNIDIGNDASILHYKTIIDFDLTSIPACSHISSANLQLYVTSGVSSGKMRVQLLSAPAILDETTWNEISTDVDWPSGGGGPEDVSQNPFLEVNYPLTAGGYWTIPNLAKHVKFALKHYNRILRLMLQDAIPLTANTHSEFVSFEGSNPPLLNINYVIPDSVNVNYKGRRLHYTCAKFKKSVYA
jgi:hypothetical protein